MSAQELMEAIEKIAPELQALSRESETQRHPPEALAALHKQARFPMAKVPHEIGGYEISPAEELAFFERLAYLNPTSGWVAFVQCGTAGMLGSKLPEAGLEKVFAEDSPLLSGIASPSGKSRAVEGGYRVSGHWAYASGVHVAEWVMVMTICDEPAGLRMVVVPHDAIEIRDDWHVATNIGTGSVDIVIDDVFVPKEMTAEPLVQYRGGAQYQNLGLRGYVGSENVGFSLGVAQRMVDEIALLARTKKRMLSPESVGERGAFQMELGRTDAAIRAARAYITTEYERVFEIAQNNDSPIDEIEEARLGAAISWSTESVCQAALRLLPYAGAGAMHLDNSIQRTFRDLIGSGQHFMASNEALDHWGRALLSVATKPT
jgi:alkylation response protein AidB-like acyl-CoA dehydrogenase